MNCARLSSPVGSYQMMSAPLYSFFTFDERKVALTPAVQTKSFLRRMSPSRVSSTPWLLILPMFCSTELKPVVPEMGTSCSKFFELRVKYSTVPRSR